MYDTKVPQYLLIVLKKKKVNCNRVTNDSDQLITCVSKFVFIWDSEQMAIVINLVMTYNDNY